jgi:hypothetical protein
MKNELALQECSTYAKEGKPASTWLSDAVLEWKERERFRLKKG